MKKKDFILIVCILAAALAVWFLFSLFYGEEGGKLKITVDNQVYGVYELTEDQNISIGDTNECQIKDGKVTMLYAKCPDQVCVHATAISKNGQTIICMPNKVVLEIITEDTDGSVDIMVK